MKIKIELYCKTAEEAADAMARLNGGGHTSPNPRPKLIDLAGQEVKPLPIKPDPAQTRLVPAKQRQRRNYRKFSFKRCLGKTLPKYLSNDVPSDLAHGDKDKLMKHLRKVGVPYRYPNRQLKVAISNYQRRHKGSKFYDTQEVAEEVA